MFLAEIGQEEPGLNRLIRAAYKLLGLQTYFTAGVKEVRAWTIHIGDTGPQAAGVIHTDFEKRLHPRPDHRLRRLHRLQGRAGRQGRGQDARGRQGVRRQGRRRDELPVQRLSRGAGLDDRRPPPEQLPLAARAVAARRARAALRDRALPARRRRPCWRRPHLRACIRWASRRWSPTTARRWPSRAPSSRPGRALRQRPLAPAAGTPERLRYRYWLHYAEGSAMPPLLLKLVFDRIEKAQMPFFARPIAQGHRGQGASRASSCRNIKTPPRLHGSRARQEQWFAGNDSAPPTSR